MEEKETMDEEIYQNTLNSVIKRISHLENEVRELHQLLFVQKPQLAKPIDKPSPSSTLMLMCLNLWWLEPIAGRSHAWATSASAMLAVTLLSAIAVVVNLSSSTCSPVLGTLHRQRC